MEKLAGSSPKSSIDIDPAAWFAEWTYSNRAVCVVRG